MQVPSALFLRVEAGFESELSAAARFGAVAAGSASAANGQQSGARGAESLLLGSPSADLGGTSLVSARSRTAVCLRGQV